MNNIREFGEINKLTYTVDSNSKGNIFKLDDGTTYYKTVRFSQYGH